MFFLFRGKQGPSGGIPRRQDDNIKTPFGQINCVQRRIFIQSQLISMIKGYQILSFHQDYKAYQKTSHEENR